MRARGTYDVTPDLLDTKKGVGEQVQTNRQDGILFLVGVFYLQRIMDNKCQQLDRTILVFGERAI